MSNEDKNFDDLLINYFSGNISETEEMQLVRLLKSDEAFKLQFDKMKKLHAISYIPKIEQEKQANYNKLIGQLKNDKVHNRHHGLSVTAFQRIAAIVALIISVSIALFYIVRDITSDADPMMYSETIVPLGSQTKIILPDSTIVWLNSGSSLKYHQTFGKKDRVVTLTGEAYFEVKKDKSKPFLVNTDNIEIKVLGTVFNVRAYDEDEDIVINLIEGSVHLNFPKVNNSETLTLKPNDKVIFNKISKTIDFTKADAARSALWTTGKLCFVNATIEQITKDLERKYNVNIHITNQKISNEIFSGSINVNQPLNDILRYIDVDKKFKINNIGDTIMIK